jgi:hypothetical protein
MKECCKKLQERLDKWTNWDKGHIVNCAVCGKAVYKQTEAKEK